MRKTENLKACVVANIRTNENYYKLLQQMKAINQKFNFINNLKAYLIKFITYYTV